MQEVSTWIHKCLPTDKICIYCSMNICIYERRQKQPQSYLMMSTTVITRVVMTVVLFIMFLQFNVFTVKRTEIEETEMDSGFVICEAIFIVSLHSH